LKAEKLLCDREGFPGYCQIACIYLRALLLGRNLPVMSSGNSQRGTMAAKELGFMRGGV